MKEEILEADVLCVGGGIAGLMAAIRASELGAKVIVAEKGNTLRSGAGTSGNDHFCCYIPEVHGPDVQAAITELAFGQSAGMLTDPVLARAWLENTFHIVKLWDEWGIPMKYEGKYEFAGHTFPGRPHRTWLKYMGQMQKPVLTKEAKKRGAKIINRVMVFELLGDETIRGALGIHTREEKLMIFKAKSVILGTGGISRLFQGYTPGWLFNIANPGANSGDGRAMALRAGAKLVGLEMVGRHASPKYFSRAGQATWVGVVRDTTGKAVGPFVSQPDRRYGDPIIEVNKWLFEENTQAGKGPVYMDCRGISDEDLAYMQHFMNNEGNSALMKHFEEEGIDLRKHPVEFMTDPAIPYIGFVKINSKVETSIKGLYAAGDESFPTMSPSATLGWLSGENAAEYAGKAPSADLDQEKTKIEEKMHLIHEILSRKDGPNWKEANIALQQVMHDYAGDVRYESLLTAGLEHMRRLKRKAYQTMMAENQHELMRGLETLNLFDVGESVFVAAKERKETRGRHERLDYPYTNPLLSNKALLVRHKDGQPVAEWVER